MRNEELKKKLIERCKINPESSCWEWIEKIDKKGYGIFGFNGISGGAHRLSYMAYKGDIPKGLLVCHSCDNRRCINPDHLFIGTYKDNWQDAWSKGRIQIGLKKRKERSERHRKWREERKNNFSCIKNDEKST